MYYMRLNSEVSMAFSRFYNFLIMISRVLFDSVSKKNLIELVHMK